MNIIRYKILYVLGLLVVGSAEDFFLCACFFAFVNYFLYFCGYGIGDIT